MAAIGIPDDTDFLTGKNPIAKCSLEMFFSPCSKANDAAELWNETGNILFLECVVYEHFSVRSRFSEAEITFERRIDIAVSSLVTFSADYLTHQHADPICWSSPSIFEMSQN